MKTLYATLFTLFVIYHNCYSDEEDCARHFVEYINQHIIKNARKYTQLEWAYDSNMTKETAKNFLVFQEKAARDTRIAVEQLKKYQWKTFKDEDLKRQIKLFFYTSEGCLPSGKFIHLEQLVKKMTEEYEETIIMDYNEKDKIGLKKVLSQFKVETDFEKLKYYWVSFKNQLGPKVRTLYTQYIDLINNSAITLGYKDAAEMWYDEIEDKNILEEIKYSFKQMTPLYQQLHAYILYGLKELHGSDIIKGDHIPVHALGNIHADNWEFICDQSLPYPVTTKNDSYTMFSKSSRKIIDFYKCVNLFLSTMNLNAAPFSFWEKSIFERQEGRNSLSIPSVYDFFDNNDYRVIHTPSTMLVETTYSSVFTLMGRLIYYMYRSHLPPIYRILSTAGFAQIGTVIKLAFTNSDTISQLRRYYEMTEDDYKINTLYLNGMSDIPFLAFTYTVEAWRMRVFSGQIKPENYNCEFWKLFSTHLGLEPPVDRSEEDFDIASFQQIVRNHRSHRAFISQLASYQIFKSLCIVAGELKPDGTGKELFKCNLQGNENVANLLINYLSMGRSKPWKEALATITGNTTLNADALLEYYKPLYDWLIEQNKQANVSIGFNNPATKCV